MVAICAVVIQRLIVFTVGYADNGPVGRLLHIRPDSGLSLWDQWDVTHFLWVAQHGYATFPAQPYHPEAFFRLLPLLVRAVAAFGIVPIAAALEINTVALVRSDAILTNFVRTASERASVREQRCSRFCFPTAVFLVVLYSEALFLARAVPSFLFARRQR
jgi:Mannosyltransferase (PIG-V)